MHGDNLDAYLSNGVTFSKNGVKKHFENARTCAKEELEGRGK